MTKRVPAEVFHPCVTLEEERIARGLTKRAMARDLGFSVQYVSDVTLGRRGISVEFALALERAWGGSAEFWMNLQTSWDLGFERALRAEYARTHRGQGEQQWTK